jgi:hypothetical protein
MGFHANIGYKCNCSSKKRRYREWMKAISEERPAHDQSCKRVNPLCTDGCQTVNVDESVGVESIK